MDLGRIHCFLVATRAGEVVYERFYERMNEVEKAGIRAALQLASSGSRIADEQDGVGVYKSARFVFIPVTDLVFYLLGSGEFDEMALAEVTKAIIAALREVLGRTLSSQLLFEKYVKLVLVVDEVINEGILESVDKDAIKRGVVNSKALWE